VPRSLVIAAAALLSVAWATSINARAQAAGDIAVVVHPGVEIENLTMADLRRVWLGDREFWASGERIVLLVRAPVARERDVVVSTLCRMTEAQFRQHWIAKVFRNESPTGPKIAYSAESALDQVSRVPGAITLVPAASVTSAVKVVRIDGLRPGDADYPLR
jgi:hypothetical protein